MKIGLVRCLFSAAGTVVVVEEDEAGTEVATSSWEEADGHREVASLHNVDQSHVKVPGTAVDDAGLPLPTNNCPRYRCHCHSNCPVFEDCQPSFLVVHTQATTARQKRM